MSVLVMADRSSQMSLNEGPGLVIMGTEPGCGKTVLACGLAGALRELNYKVQVLKPVFLGSKRSAELEASFIAKVGHSRPNYPLTVLERPAALRKAVLNDVVMLSRNPEQVSLIEMPAGCATPVCYENTGRDAISNQWQDSTDLAREFSRPCVLVAKHQGDALERLVIGSSYLQSKGLDVCALATVEVSQGGGAELENQTTRDDFAMGLFGRTDVPFLGCMKFSPSISVADCIQGTLIKQTSGLDLMVLLRSLELAVPDRQLV